MKYKWIHYYQPPDWTWWEKLQFKLQKSHVSLDFGYSRVDVIRAVHFKVWRGKVWITKETRPIR